MHPKELANQFAKKIVEGAFQEAHGMLAGSLQEDWPPQVLKETFEEMIEYFEGSPIHLVMDFDDEFSITKIEGGTFVYVPVESDEGSEAIAVLVNGNGQIIEVEFGRP